MLYLQERIHKMGYECVTLCLGCSDQNVQEQMNEHIDAPYR